MLPAPSQGNMEEQPNNSLQIGGSKQPKMNCVVKKNLVQDQSVGVLTTARSLKLRGDD